ncbi:MAG: cobalt ECF transporter T component CbiQ [Rubrivivax sp.]|nr:cobalt ECF transporter T component CbiQ [Rubrivivax sp.]
MATLQAALADLRRLDELAARDTRLTRLDPRAKLVTTFAFVLVVVSFERHAVAALLPLALFPIVLASMGEVPAAALLRKLALAAPLALLVGLPNPWLERTPVLLFGETTLAAGWWSLASILLRFVLTVGAALVLVAGTGITALCAALAQLGVPRVFTVQLLFLYRYSFVLGAEAARLSTARQLRSAGRRASFASHGPLLGHLLLRAFGRAGRIHQAMVARGFDGELRNLRRWRWQPPDTCFVLGWCSVFALLRSVDVPALMGRALLACCS